LKRDRIELDLLRSFWNYLGITAPFVLSLSFLFSSLNPSYLWSEASLSNWNWSSYSSRSVLWWSNIYFL